MELKTTQTLFAAVLALSGTAALAQAAAPAPEPDSSLSFNAGVVTDYRYRGISQTRMDPAIQGGADWTHKSGLYVGTWLSSIKWIKDIGGHSDVEWDIYGGYKGTAGGIGYDVGVLRYQYQGNDLNPDASTTEIYVAGTIAQYTLKYSHSLTNLFGFANSKNSYYLDASAAFDLGNGWSVTPHVGYQHVAHNSPFSYTDYAVTLGKDFGNGFSASAMLVATDADKTLYVTPSGKFTGRTGLVLGAKYSF